MERDTVVLEMFSSLRGMVSNFAYKFGLDFDDCLQDASLIMLEVWPKIPEGCPNAKAYLNGVVRNTLYKRWLQAQRFETYSLDEPLTPDCAETYADMLEVPPVQDTRRSDHITKTVHVALRSLSLEVQLHAMAFYGLSSYKPVLPRTACKVKYGRRKVCMRKSLAVAFRKDARVLALLS